MLELQDLKENTNPIIVKKKIEKKIIVKTDK